LEAVIVMTKILTHFIHFLWKSVSPIQ